MLRAFDAMGSEIREGDFVTSLGNPSNFGTVEGIEEGGELQPGPVVAFRFEGAMLPPDSQRPVMRISAAGVVVKPDDQIRLLKPPPPAPCG